ncbi:MULTISPECIES: hypothetical protein [Hydrocarboniphaga]|uniref:Uncharacterized protein n=1 Tax=Hydrocarboniphaga effusa AP103 TaxID=1172194 RepID=I8T4X5_9GAMM|nr:MULTISPECIES: hypothetical protein [Hydrocarboniphaga]EIT68793.1 hypothetical protein WQQ_39880 [Hydrocarboniphaga effusa AP103]MDZ4076863.1 hypothetical protein [Hydrocarboniphaga sp.]
MEDNNTQDPDVIREGSLLFPVVGFGLAPVQNGIGVLKLRYFESPGQAVPSETPAYSLNISTLRRMGEQFLVMAGYLEAAQEKLAEKAQKAE